jgi:membrane protein
VDDDVLGRAAGVAYYAFLSLPPAVMMVFALAGVFGGAALADWIRAQAATVLPASASALIDSFIRDTVEQNAPGPFSLGLILALWGASGLFMSLGTALNQAYDIEKQRSWIQRRAISVGVMIVAVALFLLAGGALLAGPGLAHAVGLFGAGEVAWRILQWPVAFCFMVAAFWVVYYVLPNKDQSDEKGTLLVGALVAALLWIAATALFRLYVANFSSYSQTYGILGTIIVLLLYLYVTSIVVLAGGELAAEMEVRS